MERYKIVPLFFCFNFFYLIVLVIILLPFLFPGLLISTEAEFVEVAGFFTIVRGVELAFFLQLHMIDHF